jgi:hypothetical protein
MISASVVEPIKKPQKKEIPYVFWIDLIVVVDE